MIEKKNPAKAYLMRYRGLKAKCAALERAIRAAFEDATNTTVALKEIVVQTSGGGEMMANAVVNAMDATAMLEDARRECQREASQMAQLVKNLPAM